METYAKRNEEHLIYHLHVERDGNDKNIENVIHTNKKCFTCDICGQAFLQKQFLEEHSNIHTKDKPYSCDVSGKGFFHQNRINVLYQTHSNEKLYSCSACGKVFSVKSNSYRHYQTHINEGPVSCEVCGKSYSRKDRLKVHYRTHANEKPFSCDVCGKKMYQKCDLNRHYRIHTNKKPYSCDICHKNFSEKSNLTAHIRTHTNEKPYTCNVCDKAFSNKVNIVRGKRKTSQEYECKKCGRKHKPRECPAFGKICTKCKKKNHFAAKCFQSSKNVNEMKVPDNELCFYIDSVNKNDVISDSMNKIEMVSKDMETWYKSVKLNVNDKCFEIDFKLDTGAEVNILPLYVLNVVKVKPKLCETNLSLTAFGDFKLKPEGTLIINCSTSKLKNIPLQFYVVNVKSKPILGLKGCIDLKLLERIDAIECSKLSKIELIKQYNDVFTGTGEFPDEPYHISLKDNAIPVIHPPRRVPQALQPKLKETLNRLEKEGIVSKVNKPTDWVQSLVIVEKQNGNLRLCLDPRDLNKLNQATRAHGAPNPQVNAPNRLGETENDYSQYPPYPAVADREREGLLAGGMTHH
ncbi:unnamed protein product [Larinioides sclopetarius]|uniref:C2H2-type domain-containing protein n=1 Tax=Larinioides sclopetarius TaxID=280406 RepID=A0AAV2BL05_9ARAC